MRLFLRCPDAALGIAVDGFSVAVGHGGAGDAPLRVAIGRPALAVGRRRALLAPLRVPVDAVGGRDKCRNDRNAHEKSTNDVHDFLPSFGRCRVRKTNNRFLTRKPHSKRIARSFLSGPSTTVTVLLHSTPPSPESFRHCTLFRRCKATRFSARPRINKHLLQTHGLDKQCRP